MFVELQSGFSVWANVRFWGNLEASSSGFSYAFFAIVSDDIPVLFSQVHDGSDFASDAFELDLRGPLRPYRMRIFTVPDPDPHDF